MSAFGTKQTLEVLCTLSILLSNPL